VAAYVVLGIAWAAHILPREIGRAGIWLLEPQSTAVTLLIAFMVLALAVTMVLLLNDSIPNTRRIFAELGEGGALILACEGSAGRKTRSQADSSVEDAHENTTACADARWQMLSKRYFLTEREIEVVRLLTQGRSRADIGKKLYITENTVRTHLKSVYGKLGIHSKQGLIDLLENQK
jgi:DNA-binding CsgD family transcriptional regulator